MQSKAVVVRYLQSRAYDRLNLWKGLRDKLCCKSSESMVPSYDAHDVMFTETVLALDSVVNAEQPVAAMYDPVYREGYNLATMYLVAHVVYKAATKVIEAYERVTLSPCFLVGHPELDAWSQYYANALTHYAGAGQSYAELRQATTLGYNTLMSTSPSTVDKDWLRAWLHACELNSRDYFPLAGIEESHNSNSFQQGVVSTGYEIALARLEEQGASAGLLRLFHLLGEHNMKLVGPESAYVLVGKSTCESIIGQIQRAAGRNKSAMVNEVVNVSFENGRVTCRPEFRAYALPHVSVSRVGMFVETALLVRSDNNLRVGERVELARAYKSSETRIDAFRGCKADQCVFTTVAEERHRAAAYIAEPEEDSVVALSLAADGDGYVVFDVGDRSYRFVAHARAFSATKMSRFTSVRSGHTATLEEMLKTTECVADKDGAMRCVGTMRRAHTLVHNRFVTVDVESIKQGAEAYRISMAVEGELFPVATPRKTVYARFVVDVAISRVARADDEGNEIGAIRVSPVNAHLIVSRIDGMMELD
jgi:hypothetical protein